MITFCYIVSRTTPVFAGIGGRAATTPDVGGSPRSRRGRRIRGVTLSWRASFCIVDLLESRWKGRGSNRESADYVEPIVKGLIW